MFYKSSQTNEALSFGKQCLSDHDNTFNTTDHIPDSSFNTNSVINVKYAENGKRKPKDVEILSFETKSVFKYWPFCKGWQV